MRHASWEMGQTGQISGQPSLLGQRMLFDDLNYRSTTPGIRTKYSDEKLYAILVRNRAGTTLTAGQACKWDTANEGPGKAVTGAGAGDAICGFVDGAIATGVTVADGDYFLLIVAGPTWVQGSGDGVAVAVGDTLVGGLASGRVAKSFGSGNSTILYSTIAESTEHENTTDAANFDQSYTFPAKSLRVGDLIRVRANVTVNDNNSTDTLTLLLTLGGTTLVTTGAVDVADNDIGFIDALLTVRTIGATGTLVGSGLVGLGVPGTVTGKAWHLASTTFDFTGTLALAINADWSVAHADNEVSLTQFVIELIRPSSLGGASTVGVALAALAAGHTAGDLVRARVSCESLSRSA